MSDNVKSPDSPERPSEIHIDPSAYRSAEDVLRIARGNLDSPLSLDGPSKVTVQLDDREMPVEIVAEGSWIIRSAQTVEHPDSDVHKTVILIEPIGK